MDGTYSTWENHDHGERNLKMICRKLSTMAPWHHYGINESQTDVKHSMINVYLNGIFFFIRDLGMHYEQLKKTIAFSGNDTKKSGTNLV
jgi:hypothetical protein